MKKYLFTLALLLTVGLTVPAAAQNTKKNVTTELVDSTAKDGVEAYSDTTDTADTDTTLVSSSHRIVGYQKGVNFDIANFADWEKFGIVGGLGGMLFVLAIVFIVMVLCPVFILFILLYFINKNRKEKMRLAQMAMQNGQPIPEQLLTENQGSNDATYQSGMRQLFLGIGLMVFLGYTAGNVGFGIGALVFFIGLGKVVIAKTNKNVEQ